MGGERRYRDLLNRWNSGPEEYMVTGAEAYLSERLGLRSFEQRIDHPDRQRGGMPLSKVLFLRLMDTRRMKSRTGPDLVLG